MSSDRASNNQFLTQCKRQRLLRGGPGGHYIESVDVPDGTKSGDVGEPQASPADYVGPPSSMSYTSRGDDIYIFGKWTDAQLGVLLAGLK